MIDLHKRNSDIKRIPNTEGDHGCGAFWWGELKILASTGGDWDHVSVSCKDRVPTWDEMQQVHRAFFKDDEVAMQLHLPPSDHINVHPFVLHLWRPRRGQKIPLPPKEFV
jgi:hypothetical protein